MVGCVQLRAHHLAEVGPATRLSRRRLDDAGQLHLELDGAVEVEVPVEAVLVVTGGCDRADHEAPRPTDLGSAGPHVDVLPEDPVVLLVHADAVLEHLRVAVLVGEGHVEVVNLAQAVAPERQRVGHAAESPFAGVEGVLPPVHRPGVAVGHHHLVDGRAVQDRADTAPVVVADGVQDQALVLLHRDAERPLLPAHEVALDGEARSLGLADLERLQVCAQRSDVVGEVARVLGRQWHHAGVDDLEHLAPRHVDEGEKPFDRAGIAVVSRRLAEERDAPADAPALLERQAEVARGPRVDLDEVEVGDAALLESGDVVGVCLQAEDGVERLLEQQPGPHPGHLRP